MFALGVIAATVIDRPFNGSNPPSASGPRAGQSGGGANVAIDENTGAVSVDRANATRNGAGFVTGNQRSGGNGSGTSAGRNSNGGGGGGGGGGQTPGQPPPGGGPPPTPAPAPEVLAGVYVPAAGTSLGVGGNCTGLTLLTQTTVGCDPGQGLGLAEVRLAGMSIVLGQ
jgi:hypothetical protein